jgi:hypothetical protein
VSLLLAADAVELYPPDGTDPHGLAEPGTERAWAGVGNLQLSAGTTDPRAADGGGRGPFDPAVKPGGLLFLPLDASPRDGWVAKVRGRCWALSQVRAVMDPAGGGLDCWMATVADAGRWPGG